MDRISIARIGKTHGVKGYIRLKSFAGEYEHLFSIEDAVVVTRAGKEKAVRIEDMRALGDQVVVKFAGYDSPEAARELSGSELQAASVHAAPLREGEYYIADLIGCGLFFDEQKLGDVVGVAEIGHADLLEVKTGEKAHRYVPLKDQYVDRVDTTAKRIELRVGWILE